MWKGGGGWRGNDRTVGYLLYILCETLPQRVANRAAFYKSAALVKVDPSPIPVFHIRNHQARKGQREG